MSERPPIPEAVKRAVRQRCKFGCVICGCPLYHYDHIVEYSETQEHDADNLVLLCALHHDQKSRGQLPISAVRRHLDRVVEAGARVQNGSIELFFENNVVLLFGTNVVVPELHSGRPWLPAIVIDDVVVLGFRLEDGRPLISARMFDAENSLVLNVDNSELGHTDRLWDITYVGTTLTLRQAQRNILLEIAFDPKQGEIRIDRGTIYAEGVGLRISNGNVVLLNTGATFGHNYGHGVGLRFGVQRNPELRRASLQSYGAVEIPRYQYDREGGNDSTPASISADSTPSGNTGESNVSTRETCQGASVRLTDLVYIDADSLPRIDNYEFLSCKIVGPIVLVPAEQCGISHCRVDPAQFWVMQEGRPYFGAVLLRNCVFRDCDFVNVGIAGPASFIDEFLRA